MRSRFDGQNLIAQKVFNHRVMHFFDVQAIGGDLLAAVGDEGVSVLGLLLAAVGGFWTLFGGF